MVTKLADRWTCRQLTSVCYPTRFGDTTSKHEFDARIATSRCLESVFTFLLRPQYSEETHCTYLFTLYLLHDIPSVLVQLHIEQ